MSVGWVVKRSGDLDSPLVDDNWAVADIVVGIEVEAELEIYGTIALRLGMQLVAINQPRLVGFVKSLFFSPA